MNTGLLKTLKAEKKRRKRRKRLNLVGEEDSGAQLFNTNRVRAVLTYRAEQEAKAAAEKSEKSAKKALAQENKQKKEEEAQERALQRQVEREAKAEIKAKKTAEKEAKKEATKAAKTSQKKSLIVKLPLKSLSNVTTKVVSFVEEVDVIGEVEGVHLRQTRTRAISLPHRYKN